MFKFRKGFFYYDASKQFKDGALYVNGKTVTLDLNGHSIVHKNARKYDIISENGNFSLKDSSGKKNAVNGILANGGSVLVDGVTISGSTDAGIRADRLSMTIKNTTFINNRITIVGNRLTNGTVSNAFLGENTTSKCIFKISDNIDPNSRIGVTSPTTDKSLDICRIWNKSAYENAADVFSYDNSNYTINRYTHWYSDYWFVEIVRN